MPSASSAASSEADRNLVGELLHHSDARPCEAVTVVGRGTAGLLAELCRLDFDHVCLAVAPCPAAAETADVLWIPHAAPEAMAAGRLHGFVQVLREGGTIVLQGDLSASSPQAVETLRRLLLAEGFGAIGQAVDAGGFYLSARKPRRRHRPRLAA